MFLTRRAVATTATSAAPRRWLATRRFGDKEDDANEFDPDDRSGERTFNYRGRSSLTGHETAFGSQATLEAVPLDIRSITSCGLKSFRVNGKLIRGPILVTRTLCFEWRVQGAELATVRDLRIEDFELLTKISPPVSLIILGTGAAVDFPDAQLLKQLRDIAPVEINDTLNGAGLFNVLNKEDRFVAACMLPIHAWPEKKKWIRD